MRGARLAQAGLCAVVLTLAAASGARGDRSAASGDVRTGGPLQASAAAPAPPASDWRHAFVSVFMLAHTKSGGLTQVLPGSRVRTGEQIDFHLTVSSPAWVYLIQVNPAGKAELLYPEEGEPARLEAGREYRAPADPSVSFTLDQTVGTEQIVLVASRQPLGAVDRNLADVIANVRRTGGWPGPAAVDRNAAATSGGAGAARRGRAAVPADNDDPHPGPGVADAMTRGRTLTNGRTGRALSLAANADGIAAGTFRFEHVP